MPAQPHTIATRQRCIDCDKPLVVTRTPDPRCQGCAERYFTGMVRAGASSRHLPNPLGHNQHSQSEWSDEGLGRAAALTWAEAHPCPIEKSAKESAA